VKASQGVDLEVSSGFHLLGGDQTCESSGFKWRKHVELQKLGLASILLCSMLVGLLEDLASVGGVLRDIINVSKSLDLRLGDPG
jgi:hypothetical protein